MIHYSACPFCSSKEITEVLQVKDYTVSGETFPVIECKSCTGRFTDNVPTQVEIGPYYKSENYISHTDTRKGLVNNLYHIFRKLTVKGKRNIVKKYCGLSRGRLLDIGAGTGLFLQEMKKSGWEAKGLEPDEEARQKAKELRGVEMLPPADLFTFPAATYEAVTMWHVLEHVHQLHEYIQQIKTILTPDGRLFIAVPNYTSKDAQHYGKYWAAYDVPRHLYHFSPASMKTLLATHGLHVKKILPMWLDSYYVSILSERYRTGKEALLSAGMQGNFSNASALANPEKCSSVIYIVGKIN